MLCEDQTRLLNLYKAAVSHYSAMVHDLTLTRGKISKQEYHRLMAVTDKARVASERARLALDRHTYNTDAECTIEKLRMSARVA